MSGSEGTRVSKGFSQCGGILRVRWALAILVSEGHLFMDLLKLTIIHLPESLSFTFDTFPRLAKGWAAQLEEMKAARADDKQDADQSRGANMAAADLAAADVIPSGGGGGGGGEESKLKPRVGRRVNRLYMSGTCMTQLVNGGPPIT
jgi:hypothetical protein